MRQGSIPSVTIRLGSPTSIELRMISFRLVSGNAAGGSRTGFTPMEQRVYFPALLALF